MNNRNLTILAAAAVVLLAWAIVQSRLSDRRVVKAAQTGPLLQGLETGDIDRVELGTGEEAVQLKRQGQGFVITSKDDYPAQTKTINELITNCLDIQTIERVTDSAANHEDLEVTEDKGRQVVKFFDLDDQLITGVVVGKYTEQGAGSYVRLVNSDDVYLTESSPYIRTGALDYSETNLVSVDQYKITQVRITTPGDDFTLRQEPNDTIVLALTAAEAVPKLKQTEAQQVYTALSSLYLTDVRKDPAPTEQLEFNTTYRCSLQDSTVYILQVAARDDKYFLKCSALFTDQTPVTMNRNKVETEAQLQEKEAKLLAREAALKFAAQHQGWIYEIASWKGENLTKKLSDLIDK